MYFSAEILSDLDNIEPVIEITYRKRKRLDQGVLYIGAILRAKI